MADMIWPTVCKTISQPYGKKNSRYVSGYHTGLDIACVNGSPIRAAHDGTVTGAGWNGPYGKQVKIKRGDIETWYNHLSVIRVSKGDNVSQGKIIGLEGTTGQSTGPHLHFEVRLNGKDVDPMPYLDGSKIITASDATQAGIGDVLSFPGKILDFFEWLGDTKNWYRVGMVFGGAILIWMTIVGIGKSKVGGLLGGTAQTAGKNAAQAVKSVGKKVTSNAKTGSAGQ